MRNKINLTTNCSIMICNGMQLDRKFTRIRIVLKTKIFFPSVFLQTNTRTRSVFESFSPVHTKTLIQWKKDSIFYRAYMTPPYSKTSVFVHLQENDKQALKKKHFGGHFQKLRVWCAKTSFSCGRKAKTEKNISVFKKYPDCVLLTNKN